MSNTEKILNVKTSSFPVYIKALGILKFLGGVVLIANYHYLKGTMFLIPGLVLTFSYFGYIIDYERKMYKEYLSLLLFRAGKWQSISKYDFIFVRKVNGKTSSDNWGRWKPALHQFVCYKVFLKGRQGRQGIELLVSENKEEAIDFGKFVAEKLRFEVIIEVDEAY
ncbi:MAG: hypothetical protein K2X86_13130 [Cytophagaceae bacterium]|nr:hypothetical protein [Cytophagaceae bacterium]